MLLLSFCFLQEKLDAIDDERQAHAGIFAQRASEQGALCGAPACNFQASRLLCLQQLLGGGGAWQAVLTGCACLQHTCSPASCARPPLRRQGAARAGCLLSPAQPQLSVRMLSMMGCLQNSGARAACCSCGHAA